MKRAKYFFILGILVFNMSCWAGEGELALEKPLRQLIAQANPALRGIGAIKLTIKSSGDARMMDPSFWAGLGAKVDKQLTDGGLKVYDPNMLARLRVPFDLPEFTVDVDVRRFAEQQSFFTIRVLLTRPVYIAVRDRMAGNVKPGTMVRAAVWTIASSISPASPEDLQGLITEVALQETETFVATWVASNPPESRGGDTSMTVVEPKVSEQRTGSASSTVQYVGSKKSTVFHLRNCRSVKSISSRNLTTYKTRSEAIKAGKRPCMLCNP
ncbi:MAG: hypothetical protein ACYS8Z_11480 [Planctomycetota bacterium]|jgi:hypothetical protein